MYEFYKKHHTKMHDGIAIKMFEEELHKAKEHEKDDDDDYMCHLATLHEMIEDFFLAKGTTPGKHKNPATS